MHVSTRIAKRWKTNTCFESSSWLLLITVSIQYVPVFVALCNLRLDLLMTSTQCCLLHIIDIHTIHVSTPTHTYTHTNTHAQFSAKPVGAGQTSLLTLSPVITPILYPHPAYTKTTYSTPPERKDTYDHTHFDKHDFPVGLSHILWCLRILL